MFTARYALSPRVKQILFVFKGLNIAWNSLVRKPLRSRAGKILLCLVIGVVIK
jgi:hypothetical protein